MNKEIVCIECPVGCVLSVDWEGCTVNKVEGNKCPKGVAYAGQEVVDPVRILTAVVACRDGMSLKMLPVRTNKPIPFSRQMEAMQGIRKMIIRRPMKAGEIVFEDFLGLDVHLIATRDVE